MDNLKMLDYLEFIYGDKPISEIKKEVVKDTSSICVECDGKGKIGFGRGIYMDYESNSFSMDYESNNSSNERPYATEHMFKIMDCGYCSGKGYIIKEANKAEV